MRYSIFISIFSFLTLAGITTSFGQDPVRPNPLFDSTSLYSTPYDTTRPAQKPRIVMSPDSIDAKIEYGSIDSNYIDNETRRVYLFGKAYVRYKDLSITADYIVVDLDSSIATAEGRLDSLGQLTGTPEFTMGSESFPAEKMRYNFVTRKGFIYNVLTKQNDLLIHGEKTKLVGGSPASVQKDDILYNSGALITTCDAENPHYGIRASKIKTIPDKLAVVGSSHLEVFGVPTPLWLPFGFYPISDTRTAGVIVPRDYERSQSWGFGLKEFGYYFPVKEWADVRLTGDLYFNGSWGAGINTNYVRKYKFRGNVDLRYSRRINEESDSYQTHTDKSWSFRLSHNQDPKANPNQTIGGSINIQTNDFESLNYNDAQSVLTSTYHSNFSYNRRFPNKPYSLSAALTHSQNTNTHIVEIHAPELDFRLNRIYPFRSKNRTGPEQWYENIAFQYSGSGKSQLIGTDTTLFDTSTWDNAQWGAQHTATANVNFNVLKYFNFTPSVNYGETWFYKTRDYQFEFDANDTNYVQRDTILNPDGSFSHVEFDTISFGKVDPKLVPGFETFRTMSASINMNTQLFGLIQFKKGWFRGIRHVIKPNVGFSYTPPSPDSYYDETQFSILYPDSVKRFSRFTSLIYGAQPIDILQANINYGINNLIEGKYFSKKDSTEKKLKLFDNISLGGSYNIAAEYFKFSPLAINGTTRFFNGITTATVQATYSFYGRLDATHLDTALYIKTDNKLLRFENLRIRFSTHITLAQILNWLSGTPENAPTNQSGPKTSFGGRPPGHVGDFFGLLNGFSISHEFGMARTWLRGRDTTFVTTNSINMVGSMQVTPNWSIRFGNIGYDFQTKQLTYPDLGLARDLHCWELSFNFQPTRGTYSFHLGVKPSTFDFMKFQYRRGNYDTFGF